MTGLRERIHQRVSPKDLPFRFRSHEPSRTEALADAVIGFTMTLAVVSLDVPRDSGGLLTGMRGFASFGITFLMLFSVWVSHQRFSRRYGLEDDRTMWLTAGILFMVVFYTYPLKFVVSWLVDQRAGLPAPVVHRDDMLWIVSMYGIGFVCLGLLFGALHRHALSLADLLELDESERLETKLTAKMWLSSLWAGLPLAMSPMLLALPRRSLPWIVAAITYLIALFVGTGVYAWVLLGITRERERFRRVLDARAAAEPGPPTAAESGA